jgi:hypothetical protein
MAYYDPSAAKREAQEKEIYDRLKTGLLKKDLNLSDLEMIIAYGEIEKMERKIANYKKTIEEYDKFFQMLDSFLPKRFSNNDIIG